MFKKDKTPATKSTPNAVKYGVLRYSSVNIGDEIQSLAAMRFLPQVDYYIARERTDEFVPEDTSDKVKMIMNAWWMKQPEHFPPSEYIDPLFVSFHLCQNIRENFMKKKKKVYLKANGPIGCRDTGTVKYLQEHGIDAYFTGCLTTTLVPNPKLKGKIISDYILCVDVPDELIPVIEARTDKPVYHISRMLSPAFTSVDRFRVAKYMLFLYHNAHCVITPRLHVALPSTAFGTPICLLESASLERDGRFEGLEGICNEVNLEAYMKDGSLYDVNNPPANPDRYLDIRHGLEETCRNFTGYDQQTPVFEDDYNPMIDLIQLLTYDKKVNQRVLGYMSSADLVTALNARVVEKKTRHDLPY